MAKTIEAEQTKNLTVIAGWLAKWHKAKPEADHRAIPGMPDFMIGISTLSKVKVRSVFAQYTSNGFRTSQTVRFT